MTNNFLVTIGQCADVPLLGDARHHLKRDNVAISYSYQSPTAAFLVHEDPRYVLVLDGHFYLSSTDTILPAPNAKAFVDILNRQSADAALGAIEGGLYNLFLLDTVDHTITITGDWLAAVPLYYRSTTQGIAFSAKQYALADGLRADPLREIEFLQYGFLPFSESFFPPVNKRLPGQTLTVSVSSQPSISFGEKGFLFYPPPQERLGDATEVADRLHERFTQYFSRFRSLRILQGLSGGYDSRLCSAYSAPHTPQLFNFGNPRSPECLRAAQVASVLHLPLKHFEIDPAIFSGLHEGLVTWLRQPSNLAFVHVFREIQEAADSGAQVKIDGFVGDVIVGPTYYANHAVTSAKDKLLFLFRRKRFNTLLGTANDYRTFILQASRLTLPRFPDVPAGTFRKYLEYVEHRATNMVATLLPACHYHEDMLESLLLYVRGRNFIISGPVGSQAVMPVACPFIDPAIVKLCMSTDKNTRAYNRLYDTLWRRHFPALAAIEKDNTGVAAADRWPVSDIKRYATVFRKRLLRPLLRQIGVPVSRTADAYFSLAQYVAQNAAFVDARLTLGQKQYLKEVDCSPVGRDTITARLISRNILLEPSHAGS